MTIHVHIWPTCGPTAHMWPTCGHMWPLTCASLYTLVIIFSPLLCRSRATRVRLRASCAAF